MGRMVDTLAIDPKHQISDGVAVLISTTPADRFSLLRAHPDHTGFAPELSDAVGVVDRLCPPAPVRIEPVPVGGLNGKGVGHLVFRFDAPSIKATAAPLARL